MIANYYWKLYKVFHVNVVERFSLLWGLSRKHPNTQFWQKLTHLRQLYFSCLQSNSLGTWTYISRLSFQFQKQTENSYRIVTFSLIFSSIWNLGKDYKLQRIKSGVEWDVWFCFSIDWFQWIPGQVWCDANQYQTYLGFNQWVISKSLVNYSRYFLQMNVQVLSKTLWILLQMWHSHNTQNFSFTLSLMSYCWMSKPYS